MSPDDEILALLRAVPNLNVHDGEVEVDETAKIIIVELPYIVFWSSTPRDNSPRFSGRVSGGVTEFLLRGVGEDRAQAKAVLAKARAAISRKRVGGSLIRHSDDNESVRRSDKFTRPGGGPIFSGADRYSVAI